MPCAGLAARSYLNKLMFILSLMLIPNEPLLTSSLPERRRVSSGWRTMAQFLHSRRGNVIGKRSALLSSFSCSSVDIFRQKESIWQGLILVFNYYCSVKKIKIIIIIIIEYYRLSHDVVTLGCKSRRFDCVLLVFIRRWGRLVNAKPYKAWCSLKTYCVMR